MKSVIDVINLKKIYGNGTTQVEAIRGISFKVNSGEFVSLMGPSGSGKSSLLNIVGGLDSPSSGSVLIQGKSIETLSDAELTLLRRRNLGFIFQFFNLVPSMNAVENIAIPLLLDGKSKIESRKLAIKRLEQVGLGHRAQNHPHELSGGEMQRVAIARALITEPALILADEPTGNLDSKNGTQILLILRDLCQKEGRTILMVTHSIEAARYGTRVIQMQDGLIRSDQKLEAQTETGTKATDTPLVEFH